MPGYRPQPMRQQRPAAPVRRDVQMSAMGRSAQAQRRQDVLLALGAGAVLSFLGAISVGGALVALHVVIDLALVAYLVAMAAVTRREKVRDFAPMYQSAPAQRQMVPAYNDRRHVAR